MNSLRSKAGRALAWDLLGTYSGQLIGFIISIFLARLLLPSDFGLVGMSMAFINVLVIFADLGFASGLIQSKSNTSLTYSSIFYINILVAVVLAASVFFSAPLIATFYKKDAVANLVRLFSLTFLFSSFNIVQRTILRRNLAFKTLTIRNIIAQISGGTVAVFFAFRGYGVYALVIQNITSSVVNTVILWRVAEWRPKLEFSWREVKQLSSFSGYVFAQNAMYQILINLDTMVIGKIFNAATLGYYTRATSLNNLINKNSVRSISKVFFPVLSSIQDDDERFQAVYLKVIHLVAGISIVLTSFFFLCGEEIIIYLFGIKWEPSVIIFKILIVKGFTYPISSIILNSLLAKGKSRENFRFGRFRMALNVIPLGIAYFYGFFGYLYASVIVSLLNLVLNNYFVSVSLKISFQKQLSAFLPYLLVSMVSIFAIEILVSQERSVFLAFFRIVLFVIIFGSYCIFFKPPFFVEFLFYKNKLLQRAGLRTKPE